MRRKGSNCCMGALVIVLSVDTRRRMHELVGPGQFTVADNEMPRDGELCGEAREVEAG
jgi:hypothetical protein